MFSSRTASQEEYKALTDSDQNIEDSGAVPAASLCLCFAPSLPLIVMLPPASTELAQNLYHLANTNCYPTASQERLLQNYASAVLNTSETIPVPDERWLLCGFQSRNPWTDFRGAGELALRCLSWLATAHPANLASICADLNVTCDTNGRDFIHQSNYYPFAASFVNVVFLVYSYLRVETDVCPYFGGRKSDPAAHPNKKYRGTKGNVIRMMHILTETTDVHNSSSRAFCPAFGDLVTLCCIKLHQEWMKVAMQQGGNLLQFGECLDKLLPILDKIASSQRRISTELLKNVIAAPV